MFSDMSPMIVLAIFASVATAASYCNHPTCVEDCMVQGSKDADKPHGACFMIYGEGALGHGWYSW